MSKWQEPNAKHHYLALGSLSTAPIYKYIEEHPEIKNICFLLDRDKENPKAQIKCPSIYAKKENLQESLKRKALILFTIRLDFLCGNMEKRM